LRCRAVVGGANNQLADADSAEKLRIAGVLYAPDYVINIGGAMAIMGMETQGWTKRRAETEVIGTVRTALKKVFELSEREGITTEAAARLIAEKRLSQGT
jgi:glutamate dehydrogenase/leucine dehydrogenase